MLATTNDGVDDDAHLLKFRKKTWGFIFKMDLLWCYIQQKRKRFILETKPHFKRVEFILRRDFACCQIKLPGYSDMKNRTNFAVVK